MKAFDLSRPETLEQAVGLLPEAFGGSGAVLLAGGQDLLTEMKEHLVEPDRVVDLKRLPGLDRIDWTDDGGLVIGALVTLERIADDPRVRGEMTVLAEAAESIASPQIRSQGTLGGNLNQRPRCWYYRCEHALCLKKGGQECLSFGGRNKYNAILGGGPCYIVHPSDLAPALIALGAEVVLAGPEGNRVLPLERFYALPSEGDVSRETVLAANEVLTAVRVPPPAAGMRSTYIKFKERDSYDFALSSVALCLWTEGDSVAGARLVLGGVAPTPWRCASAETWLAGRTLDEETLRGAGQEALRGADPLSENGFKVPLTQALIARALRRLAG